VHLDAERIADNDVCRGSYSKTTRRGVLYENNLSSCHAVKYAWPVQVNSPMAPALASSVARDFTRCRGQDRSRVMQGECETFGFECRLSVARGSVMVMAIAVVPQALNVTVAHYYHAVRLSLLNLIAANLQFLHALQPNEQLMSVALSRPRKRDDV
jgi:hypothetical protein